MRGDTENPGHHYRPRHSELSGEETDTSFSERGVFEELELLARTPELRRAWDRVRTAAVRGAAAGVLIKGGLHTLTFVMYLLSRIRGKGRQRVTTLGDVLRDTVLHTCFLAVLGSSYTAVDEGIALVFGKASTQRWRALVAGLIAGQSLRITGSNRRHYSLATYILLRGLTLLVRTGNKPSAPPALRALLRPTRLQHGDTLLMCVAASQILYSFIMAPSTLPPTYVRFITRMGGKDPAVWAAIREHAMRNSLGLAPGPLRALQSTPLSYLNARPGRLRRTPCEFFHPGQSCAGHAVSVLPQAYGTSMALYVPFYLVSSVLVHRTALLARPRELLPKMAFAVLRSSAFLSGYIAAAFAGACTGFCVSGTNTGAVIAGSVWAGGLATLLEKKSRRMELAMYCAARALEAFIRCCWLWGSEVGSGPDSRFRRGPLPMQPSALALQQQRPPAAAGTFGIRPPPPPPTSAAAAAADAAGGGLRLDLLMFSLGCGAIMHCYSDSWGQHRDVFRSKYLNVLDFIFGNQGVQQGSISHVPTNLELVSNVGRRLRTMSRVLSNSDNSASAATFSPLPQSAAQSIADGLGLNGPAESSYGIVGHNHHGGHGYSRYVQLQQQRHQQHQQLLQQLTAGKDSTGSALGDRVAGVSPQGRLRGSISSGAAQGPCKSPVAPASSYSLGGSNPVLSSVPASGTSMCESIPRQLGGVVASQRKAEVEVDEEPTVHLGGGDQTQAAATNGVLGHSAGGGSSGTSHSSGEWEDVWAAATGSSPNAATAANAAKGTSSTTVASTSTAAPLPAPPLEQTTAADGMPHISSASMVQSRSAVRLWSSPFSAVASSKDAASATTTTGGAAAPPPSTRSWAARLVAGAFNRCTNASGNGVVSSSSLSDNTSADASGTSVPQGKMSQSRSERSTAAAVSSDNVAAARCGDIGGGGSSSNGVLGFGRLSSMRRSSTAPYGLRESARALQLLADPSSERCGHGRSSYKELQRLSCGGTSFAIPAAVAEGDVASPASTSSSSPAAWGVVALFSEALAPVPPPVPLAGGTFAAEQRQNGSVPSSPSGRRHTTPPARARPVPVPNASSRTPAFRPRKPILGANPHRTGDSAAAGPLARSLPRGSDGSSSLGSHLDHLPESEGFSIRSIHLGGSAHNISIPKSANTSNNINSYKDSGRSTTTTTTTTINKNNSFSSGAATAASGFNGFPRGYVAAATMAACSSGGSALTFELHGALSHPSPVPRAPVWPRLSSDLTTTPQSSIAVSRSAPEAGEGVLAAALAAEEEGENNGAVAPMQSAIELEVEVEVEAEAGAEVEAEVEVEVEGQRESVAV